MAVKKYYGSAAYDPSVQPRAPLSAFVTEGHKKTLGSMQAVVNGDSATSVINFGAIPSNAMIDPKSLLYATAMAGNTDFDLGLGKSGVVKDVDCLINGWDGHLGGSSVLKDLAAADAVTKCAWQIAGYDSDPGGMLDVIGTTNAQIGADGSFTLILDFATP